MKIIQVFIILFCVCAQALADIAPNPIQAKGISSKFPTEIKMTYEKVSVTLTLDSSYVHCFFILHNEGKAEKVQIGYPAMNTKPYSFPESRFAILKVFQNGKEIKDINLSSTDQRKNNPTGNTWYLWDTFLEEGETMEIEVSYSLPNGTVKNNLYYRFDYLLSTGSGWKGSIDRAEIVVTLENFDKNLILSTTPENYSVTGNQLVWKLNNIEPATKDDISIKFEKNIGHYEEKLRKNTAAFVLNEELVLSNDIRVKDNFENFDTGKIIFINVLKNAEEAKMDLPDINRSKEIILIYTKDFIPKRQVEILNSKAKGISPNKIIAIPISEFTEKYSIEIDGRMIDKKDIPENIIKLDESTITKVVVKKINKNKFHLSINSDNKIVK